MAALLLLVPTLPARACTMTIAPMPPRMAGNRIMAFDLKMRHEAVTGLRTLFPAWHITVDNDDSFIVESSGYAIVGAAFLDPPEITTLFSITPEPNYTCAKLETLHTMRLTLKLDRNDDVTGVGHPTRFVVPAGFIHIRA